MRLLLDTHALLWALSDPKKLGKRAAAALRAPETDVYASAASTWEIAIKAGLGKITVDLDVLRQGIREAEFAELDVTIARTARLRELPAARRDPFDRILVAQALEEGLTVVTHDPRFADYPAPTLWG
jgi:PIN domain nuclease of toxin-antitoxin system